jgi:AraC-like DNA-binding protein
MDSAQAGWLAGLHDTRTLSLLHLAAQRTWTLASIAQQAGASRTVLSERFARFVATPPMHYLTQWRMQRAIGLLAEPGAKKIAAVADAVGYGSEAAFSRAL